MVGRLALCVCVFGNGIPTVFAAWSTGNDQVYCDRRFGCREIKVLSAPIFFNTVFRFITVTNAFSNIIINHYIVCE